MGKRVVGPKTEKSMDDLFGSKKKRRKRKSKSKKTKKKTKKK